MSTQVLEGNRFGAHIHTFELWDTLTDTQREELLAHTRFLRCGKGTMVHRGLLRNAGTMHVTTGCLRVFILSEEGRELTMYFLREGDVFLLGSTSVLETLTYDISIDAAEDTELYISDTEAVRRIYRENINVRAYAYEHAALRLSEMLWQLQQMLFTPADRRLANFLLVESERTGSAEIHLTHEQIAQYLGTAREVVSRLIGEFSQEGLVQTSRGRIRILDRAALQLRASREYRRNL